MNAFVHAEYTSRNPGVVRADRAADLFASAVMLLERSLIAAAHSLKATWVRLSEARRQAEADAKLWDLALTDARVMADISRAMSKDAARDIRAYY